MRKYMGYLPVLLYLLMDFLGGYSFGTPMALIRILCFLLSAVLLHKGFFWGGAPGALFAVYHMIEAARRGAYVGYTDILLIVFYVVYGLFLFTVDKSPKTQKIWYVLLRMIGTVAFIFVGFYAGIVKWLIFSSIGIHAVLSAIGVLILPSLGVPLLWLKKKKKFMMFWCMGLVLYGLSLGANYGLIRYDESITVNTSPNINVHEYLPFAESSNIVQIKSETLHFTENLPRIDGAAALFPVYSGFVHATYPETTQLYDGKFEYNNTPSGYRLLAEQETDIFIGVYPSEEQRAYAEECGTTFVYTPIGTEAFVFFVHKDNPIDNLTTEQIKGIYAGEITNWKEVGGADEEIFAYQRNQGSGSQSMLERFMDGTPLMEPPTEQVQDLMSGIIERVSDYRSKAGSIGFSFRFYVEGIIKNPDIKMVSVDGIAPTADNIRNGSYPIVTPIYAVTYEEQENDNVDKLLDWILSEEGQYIIEETGYVGIGEAQS